MPELKFKAWEPPKRKPKPACLAAAQPSQQRLGPTQNSPTQSSHISQNVVEPVSSDQIDQTLRYHTEASSNIAISNIDVVLSILDDDMFVESGAISHSFGPMDLTGPSQALPTIAQSHFPYNDASDTVDRSPMESEDSDSDVNSDSQAQPIQTPISSPDHIFENSAVVEDCFTVANLSTDAPLGASTVDPSSSSGNRAGIDTHLEGLSRDRSNNANQSPNEHVSESFVDKDLRPERRSCKGSFTCNGSTRPLPDDTSIPTLSRIDQDPVDTGGLSVGETLPTGALIAPSSNRDPSPDRLAEAAINLTIEECPRGRSHPISSDDVTSHVGVELTRTRKRLNEDGSFGGGTNETPRLKRPRHNTLPSQSTLSDGGSTRTLRALPSRTGAQNSGKSALNGANDRLSRSPHALRRPLANRPRNPVSKKYRVEEPPTRDHNRERASSTYEPPVQPESPTSQKISHSAFSTTTVSARRTPVPIAHSRNPLDGHHRLNTPDQMRPCNLSRNKSGHVVRMLSKSPSFADSRPLAIECNTCGFSAEHILQLSDYVEGLLQGGDGMSTVRLFLGFIRDYAAQRRTYRKLATACDHTYDANVRGHTSDSNHVFTPANSEHNGSHNDESDIDRSGEDSDDSVSCQSESSNNREYNGIYNDESVVDNCNEDNDNSGSCYNGVSKCKPGRWSRLDEARLRAWVKEEQTWSWMAKKLHRTSVTVSKHWQVMLERETKV